MTTLHVKRIAYQAYLHLPFTQGIFRVIRSIHVPAYRIRRWLRFKGPFCLKTSEGRHVLMINYGNTLENEVFWRGVRGWEPTSVELWTRLSLTSNVILDVGANTGLYTIMAGHTNAAARLYAFEPLPDICRRLEQNLRLNRISAVVLNVALSNEAREQRIFAAQTISGTFDQASLNADLTAHRDRHEIPIVTRRLADVLEDAAIDEVDLMKIDVETFEAEVLEGMGNYLEKTKPTMLIEILNQDIARRLSHLMNGLGYSFYRVDETGRLSPLDDPSKAVHRGNYLFLNPAKHGDVVKDFTIS